MGFFGLLQRFLACYHPVKSTPKLPVPGSGLGAGTPVAFSATLVVKPHSNRHSDMKLPAWRHHGEPACRGHTPASTGDHGSGGGATLPLPSLETAQALNLPAGTPRARPGSEETAEALRRAPVAGRKLRGPEERYGS